MKTRKAIYKDGVEVRRPHEITIEGITYYGTFTDDQLVAAGYEIREIEIPEPTPYVPTYEERVVQLIRERYDLDSELALLRQRDTKPEEFAEYNDYCEECKRRAKEEAI